MRSGGPRSEAHDSVHYGVQFGRVVQNKDDEGKHRVKVKFNWLDQGDTDQTHWAQVLSPMGGSNFGWHQTPEIDDIVAVVFIHGDFSQPVVLGGIWSTQDKAPEGNEDGKNHFRGFRSRAGHRMILDDSAKGKFVVADKTGNLMLGIGNFDSDGTGPNKCAVHKPPMSATGGISMTSKQGTFDVSCPSGKLSIKADDSVKFNVKTKVEISAGSDLKATGDSAVKLTAGSPTNLDASTINFQ